MPTDDIPWRDKTLFARRELRQAGRLIHAPIGHETNIPPMVGMSFMARLAYERWITQCWREAGCPVVPDDAYFDPHDGVVVHPAFPSTCSP